MGEVGQIKDVQCCAEDADQEKAYETLNISKKEESHYATIITLTDNPADVSEDENRALTSLICLLEPSPKDKYCVD